jgi:hypothetical protein
LVLIKEESTNKTFVKVGITSKKFIVRRFSKDHGYEGYTVESILRRIDMVDAEKVETEIKDKLNKKKTVKKAATKPASQSFPTRDRDRADQSFPLKTDDKKVPPLRKIGEAIMGSVANASKPYSSSMYDKMKGRKAGGSIKMASGGKVSSASSRGDGIAQRGKTKGRMC